MTYYLIIDSISLCDIKIISRHNSLKIIKEIMGINKEKYPFKDYKILKGV